MLIGRIQGTTRVLGKSQGYLGLPIRDEIVKLDNGDEVSTMVSAWTPTPGELAALNAGASIHVSLWGQSHPPIMLGVGQTPDEAVA